ncbi:MAG: peroxide stress protein YaaA [Acidimicrobiales bacterium]
MLIVVSPAKSLDFESPLATRKHSEPRMLDQAAELVDIMADKTPEQLAKMMSISAGLAELNFERFQDWEAPFTAHNARPALLAFSGDVYLGMDAPNTFDERDYTQAQKVLRILSGLYGVLRPLDLIQPYRLEMGSTLNTPKGKDLYSFWGPDITDRINADLAESPGAKILVNLASNEYFGSIRPDALEGKLVTPTFLDSKNGGPYKVVSFFAKRARGRMAGWIITERIKSGRGLLDFTGMGYRYDAQRSAPDSPTFIREDGGMT